MKKSLLFLASLVVSSVASAQWVKPVPSSTVDMDDSGSAEQYLYNKGAVGFFAGGNDWTTRASINATGDPIRMIKLYEDDEKTVPSGTWNFGCYPSVKGTWLYVSANAFDAQWVDAGNAVGNDSYPGTDMWVVEKQENGTYKFANWAIGETFLGVAEIYEGKKGNTRTYFYNPDAKYTYTEDNEEFEAASFDGDFWDEWVFVTPEEREALVPQVELYMAAQSLNAAIENAKVENPTYNYSVIEAVYKNTASTKEELQAAQTKLAAVLSLKKALDAAKEKYPELDFSSPESVYNNIDATTEALNAAESEVTVIVNNYFSSIASFDDPYDFSESIGSTVSGFEPWVQTFTGSGTTGGSAWNTWSTEANNGGDGTDMETPFRQVWVGSGSILSDQKIHQTLAGAAPGLYKFTVDARVYSEAGKLDAFEGAYLYFGDEKVDMQEQVAIYYSGNKSVLWSKNYFTIIAIVKDNGDIDFGFEIKDANFNWISWKNVSLKYYGNENVEENALKLYKAAYTYEKADEEETLANPTVIKAYNDAVDAFNAASTKEGIKEAAANADAAWTTLTENVSIHTAFYQKISAWEQAYTEATDNGMAGDEMDAFGEFIQNEDEVEGYPTPSVGMIVSTMATKAQQYPFLTKEEADAYILKVDELWQEALTNSAVEGADMTSLLVNADFGSSTAVPQGDGTYKAGTYNTNGWTGSATLGGLNEYMTAERFNTTIDFYQTVKNAPSGLYKIETHAFVRPGNNGSFNGSEKTNTYLYMNKFRTQVENIVSDALPVNESAVNQVNCYPGPAVASGTYWPSNTWFDGFDYNGADGGYDWGYIPNCMVGAAIAFKAGRYSVVTYGMVDEGEDMKIGITSDGKKVADAENSWFLFSGFKLTYMGKDPEAVNSVLNVKQQELREFLDNEENVITTACRRTCEAAYTQAEEAHEDEMWDALNAVINALNDAQENKTALEALTPAIEDMNNAAVDIISIDGGAETEAYKKYADEVQPKTDEDAIVALDTEGLKSLTEEVKAMTEELQAAIKAIQDAEIQVLAKQLVDEATSTGEPVDMTSMIIVNPSFDTDTEGWNLNYASGTYSNLQRETASYTNDMGTTEDTEDDVTISQFVNAWGNGFKLGDGEISQATGALPAGAYALEGDFIASWQSDASVAVEGVYFFVQIGDQEFKVNLATANGKPEHYAVRFKKELDETSVKFGFRTENTNANWVSMDNLKLSTYGNDWPTAIAGLQTEATSLRNRKVFENGRIVIYKNGQKYNVAGQAIK